MSSSINSNVCTSCALRVNCIDRGNCLINRLIIIACAADMVFFIVHMMYLFGLIEDWSVFHLFSLYGMIQSTVIFINLNLTSPKNKYVSDISCYSKMETWHEISTAIVMFCLIASVCIVACGCPKMTCSSSFFMERYPFVSVDSLLGCLWTIIFFKMLHLAIVVMRPTEHSQDETNASPATPSSSSPPNLSVGLTEISKEANI